MALDHELPHSSFSKVSNSLQTSVTKWSAHMIYPCKWSNSTLNTHSLSSTSLDQQHHLFVEKHTCTICRWLLFHMPGSIQHSGTHVIPGQWAGTVHVIFKYNIVKGYSKAVFQIERYATVIWECSSHLSIFMGFQLTIQSLSQIPESIISWLLQTPPFSRHLWQNKSVFFTTSIVLIPSGANSSVYCLNLLKLLFPSCYHHWDCGIWRLSLCSKE